MIEIRVFGKKINRRVHRGHRVFFLSVLCALPSALLRRPRLYSMFGSGKSRV